MIESTIIALAMAFIVFFIRMKASKKPATLKKIVLPPIFMSTGFLMFLYTPTRIDLTYAFIAFLIGIFFSYPLIVTSEFQKKEDKVYLKRSKLFIIILLGLVLLRIGLREYINLYINVIQTSGLFFIMAFGMLLPWRLAMLVKFRKLNRQQ